MKSDGDTALIEDFFVYGGRCRHCGWEGRWVASPNDGSQAALVVFYRQMEQRFGSNTMWNDCEKCGHKTVFDLTVVEFRPRAKEEEEEPRDA